MILLEKTKQRTECKEDIPPTKHNLNLILLKLYNTDA